MNSFDALKEELKFARAYFPSSKHLLAALVEEVGELSQALMEHDRDPLVTKQDVYLEAIQVAAMAIRIAEEGDPQFEYKFNEKLPNMFSGRGDQ